MIFQGKKQFLFLNIFFSTPFYFAILYLIQFTIQVYEKQIFKENRKRKMKNGEEPKINPARLINSKVSCLDSRRFTFYALPDPVHC